LLRIEEQFSTSKIDLAHACFLQKSQAALHLIFSGNMRRLLSVEAELASLVTFAGEVIVHGNAIDALRGWTQMLSREVEAKDNSE
jgi:hypothetical protein